MNNHFKKIKHKYLAIINYFDGSTNIVRLKPNQVMEICDVFDLDKYAYEVLIYEQRNDGRYEMINWSHKELDSDGCDPILDTRDSIDKGIDQMLKYCRR